MAPWPCQTLRSLATVLALTGLLVRPAVAHELGAMRVSALFRADGTYQIDILLDTEHLPPGQSPFPSLAADLGGGASDAEIVRRIHAFTTRFLAQAHVAFDGAPADAKVVVAPVATSPSGPAPEAPPGRGTGGAPRPPAGAGSRKLAFRLMGEVPEGARAVTWRHDGAIGSYLATFQNEGDPEPAGEWLEGGKTSRPFSLRERAERLSRLDVFRLYLVLGFTHILPKGPDHILFVLGLFLLSLRIRPILSQVTAFTVAHSITLGLSIYGVVSLPPRIVEPLIALSIVYVAIENLVTEVFRPWRVGVVFCFGLLHGLGFAGVLRELGLPRSEFIPALVSFNVGVEAGQLTVIALAFLTVGVWFGAKSWYRARITCPASVLIAATGLYWTVQRVLF